MKNLITLLFLFVVTSCSTIKPATQDVISSDVQQRNTTLSTLTHWKINGKIAFLQKDKRESASINWVYNQILKQQKLDLTTYLGINVLSLESNQGQHAIEVDDKSYQTTQLNQLIYQLTGLTLPIDALTYWIKAIAYSSNDKITYHPRTKLPEQLFSEYNERSWYINYDQYKMVGKHYLPGKLTIKQSGLTIKININQWNIL